MEENDTRMRLRVTAHPVAGAGSRLRRVLHTGPMLRNTFFHPPEQQVGYLYASRADVLRLGALFRVAATSPHSAVHVPAPAGATHGGPTALLLARADTGLRPSDWPALRHGMRRASSPLTVTAPAPRPEDRTAEVHRLADRHPARFTVHAGTSFLTARPELLFWIGDLLTGTGATIAQDPRIHRHGEHLLADLAGFFAPRYTDHPMHALCVVAVDPIFHRARWQKRRAG